MNTAYSMGVTLYRFDLFSAYHDVVASVTGRHGGYSRHPFSSLNTSFTVGDDPRNVVRNRVLACLSLDLDENNLVAAQQEHGLNVTVVGEDDRGRGAVDWEGAVPDTDALITASREVFLLMTFADCAPIILYDPVHTVIGLVHAGWKGTVGGIAARAVTTMEQALGSQADHVIAAIGPAIGPCCYEVGEEVAEAARESGLNDSLLPVGSSNKVRFDLWEANRHWLLKAGLQEKNVEVATICPACHPHLFFTHRGERGRTGRFAVLAGMRRR